MPAEAAVSPVVGERRWKGGGAARAPLTCTPTLGHFRQNKGWKGLATPTRPPPPQPAPGECGQTVAGPAPMPAMPASGSRPRLPLASCRRRTNLSSPGREEKGEGQHPRQPDPTLSPQPLTLRGRHHGNVKVQEGRGGGAAPTAPLLSSSCALSFPSPHAQSLLSPGSSPTLSLLACSLSWPLCPLWVLCVAASPFSSLWLQLPPMSHYGSHGARICILPAQNLLQTTAALSLHQPPLLGWRVGAGMGAVVVQGTWAGERLGISSVTL